MAKDETILYLPVKLEWETEPADQGGSDDRGNVESLPAARYISAVKRTIGGVDHDITHLLSQEEINQLADENS